LIITCREFAKFFKENVIDYQQLIIIDDAINEDIQYNNEEMLRRLERLIDTDPLCIINTSGSTGRQKRVVLNHRSFIDFSDWAIDTLHIGEDEVVGACRPYFSISIASNYVSAFPGGRPSF